MCIKQSFLKAWDFCFNPLYIGFASWENPWRLSGLLTFLREIYVKKSKLKFHMEMLRSYVILYTQKIFKAKNHDGI